MGKREPAKLLLRAADVREAAAFYERRLGWTLERLDAAGGLALLEAAPGYSVLLAARGLSIEGERVGASSQGAVEARNEACHYEDVEQRDELCSQVIVEKRDGTQSHPAVAKRLAARSQTVGEELLAPGAHCPGEGDSFYIGVASVEERKLFLHANGFEGKLIEEDQGTIRKLLVPAPDGYTVIYWEELELSDAEIADMYVQGPDELSAAVEGLQEEQLDQAEAPGKWTIRQQVLHVVDLELAAVHKVKFALAESGRPYHGPAFSQDVWANALDYGARPIHAELALLRALRAHVIGLCRHLPAALDRYVVTSRREETVRALLKGMAGHARHHMEAIRRIRRRGGF